MRSAAGPGPRREAEEIRRHIETFLASSRQPFFLEPGEDPLSLAPESFTLENRGGRLTLHVWDQTRNVVRRVVGIGGERPGRLELLVERFGKRLGSITLYDQARPDSVSAERRGARMVFRERFRRSLARQFPNWSIRTLSTDADLEHSLSPAYPRALLTSGASGWAAIGAPPDSAADAGVLSFGLIWLDYLRRREKRLTVEGLALFLPEGAQRSACLRLQCLNPLAARFAVFVCPDDGHEEPIDPRDHGNLETRLEKCRRMTPQTAPYREWIERLVRLPHVEAVAIADGSLSLRVRGLEFARASAQALLFGLDIKHAAAASNIDEIEAIANELVRLRTPAARDRMNPLRLRQPESWLESQVRRHLDAVDAALLPEPVYGQVPAFAAGERGVIDLLAAERGGRLAVLELKVSADLHLPLQALDYWMRVRWHAAREDFSAQGYFPAVRLSAQAPRLLLVAPALDFHPTTETILRYFSPEIPVERIGLGVEWQREVKVMYRIIGSQSPV